MSKTSMRSVMSNHFSQVPEVNIPRSVFDRSCGFKTTFEAGLLYPFLLDEIVPGDSFKVDANFCLRFNDLLHPFLDNLFFETFYFFVPYRLIWKNWERFCGAQDYPGASTDYVVPQVEIPREKLTENSLYCQMGLPLANQVTTPSIKVNSLPFRAYVAIWNEWFRDENLSPSFSFGIDDNDDNADWYFIVARSKRYDYFTSCLPWPQKGPAVTLPLGGQAPVSIYGDGTPLKLTHHPKPFDGSVVPYSHSWLGALFNPNSTGDLTQQNVVFGFPNNITTSVGSVPINSELPSAMGSHTATMSQDFAKYGVPTKGQLDQIRALYNSSTGDAKTFFGSMLGTSGLIGTADLANATAVTINQLREAFAIQRIYERDARCGTRYTEVLQGHFGVINPDARLQRPEYLGGSSQRINVTQVPQTSAATASSPQANLSAYSLTGANSGFVKSFSEYGIVIGLMNVRADLTYQQGLERMWTRRTRFDFYWPALSHIGEQAVLSKEIYCDGSMNDELVFGYQERYAEYRYKPSRIAGYLNSCSSQTLDAWHLSEKFNSRPTLGSSFISTMPPISRVKAVTNQPAFLLDSYIHMKCARPMPTYAVPGLMDHF